MRYDTGWIVSRVQQVWIQIFPSPRLVTMPKLKRPVCLSIDGVRTIGLMRFPCEMLTTSSRAWTRITVSISYDVNPYFTNTSIRKYFVGNFIFNRVGAHFFSADLNGFKFRKWLNSYIWAIDWFLTGTTTSSQSGPGSYDNEEVLHFLQSSSTEVSLLDDLESYPRHLLRGLGPLQRCSQRIPQPQATG